MRPTIHETMMELAKVAAKRGTCLKKQVGCVAVNSNGHVLAITYNGQAKNQPHCTIEAPCEAYMDQTQSCRAIHSEMNMLMRCPDIDDIETIYITEKPCDKCLLSIQNTSCKSIIYGHSSIMIEISLCDEEQLI